MKVLFFIFVGLDFFRWEGKGEVAGGNFFRFYVGGTLLAGV